MHTPTRLYARSQSYRSMKLSCDATASHRTVGENFRSEISSLRCFFATSSFPVDVSNTMNPPPWNPHATKFPSGE